MTISKINWQSGRVLPTQKQNVNLRYRKKKKPPIKQETYSRKDTQIP